MTMLSRTRATFWLVFASLCGCASIQSDHFYALQPLPASIPVAHDDLTTQVSLHVSVPSMVDRNELVLYQTDSVRVLEHERWASPLTDQITAILGQDLERQRPDVLISTRRITPSGAPRFNVSAEIYDLALQANGSARLEVRWRVEQLEGGMISVGRDTFTASAIDAHGYQRSSQALSQCISLLAQRLVTQLPKPATRQP